MTGSLLNAGAIIAGSMIGMLIRSRLPQKIITIVFQGIGLFTIALGVSMWLKSDHFLLAIISIVAGGIIGQWIDIDKHLQNFSNFLHKKTNRSKMLEVPGGNRFTEGIITAFMLYCVGSMSILGPIEDGLGQTPTILYTKSLMDGISSIALASSFGSSIAFSALPLLLYQGSITLFASYFSKYLNQDVIADLTAVGGILLIGLGFSILEIKKIKVTNLLPALVVIVLLSYLFG
ncbi:MAG TPA: DUF554 domain-containing protein [Bacteroidales bacterium]|nr:DUF554 domain-containing protein [Bacteroidales bacterium]